MQALSRTPNLAFRHRHAALQPALPLLVRGHAHLLTATKGSFSAAELQRQLGHKRYQPIREMVNKLRDVMANAMMSTPSREPASWTAPSFPPKYPLKRGTNR